MKRRSADPLVTELATIRTARRMSVAKLAERAGVQRESVSRWENGHADPSLPSLRAYAGALGVDLGIVQPDGGER